MTHFEFLTVALSFVLGLAVTVLLRSLVIAFRCRRKTQMNRMPFAWAGYILVMQFDVWWELYGLASMESWSIGAFILLLLLALLLFAAGALVLPNGMDDYPEDLDRYFMEDGRWGLVLIAGFSTTAIAANIALFNVPPFGAMNTWNAVSVALIATLIAARRRAIHFAVTIFYGIWLGIYMWTFVPATY